VYADCQLSPGLPQSTQGEYESSGDELGIKNGTRDILSSHKAVDQEC